MKKLIIFTDLDGTLLDEISYAYEAAAEALRLLNEKDVPLIICSSKTRREVELYRKRLGNDHPFITENGGGIFIPKGYFLSLQELPASVEPENGLDLVRLGARYSDLRKAVDSLRTRGFDIKGFGDMTPEEIADRTGLDLREASMAKERDFGEPFFFAGDDTETGRLFSAIRDLGFNHTMGRLLHILGNSDKGKAVRILTDLYRKEYGEVFSVALGDSANDLPMLESVDHPIIVQNRNGEYNAAADNPRFVKAGGIGPQGWNKAVIKILKDYCS
jgi:mannosyl-3-phosphoglycerate phosphatase family protein